MPFVEELQARSTSSTLPCMSMMSLPVLSAAISAWRILIHRSNSRIRVVMGTCRAWGRSSNA